MRWILTRALVGLVLTAAPAWAQSSAAAAPLPPSDSSDEPVAPSSAATPPAPKDTGAPPSEEQPAPDPTGGAYTSPTLLFIPAAAVPAWKVRAMLSTEVQGPSDVHAGIRPGVGAEIGLPAGFTLGAGTNWVGGDVNADTGKTDFNLGLSPYFQARFHILGDAAGRGFQLGTSATYKFVGFEGDPGEIELALSAQYRTLRYEVGLLGVVGKDFASTDADGEAHAYALYRIVPELGVGAAGQARIAIVSQAGENSYDLVGGGIVSLTLGRYQVGALAGASTLGLARGSAGALGQLFATARF